MRELISRGASLTEIKNAARNKGVKTLLEKGMVKVEEGITSIEEVLSITMTEE
jgi:type IV pilus assembly protein PilB